jgi:excisionase family DNA binding protein
MGTIAPEQPAALALITTRTAALLLGVDPRTIRRLVDRGALHAIRYTPTSDLRFRLDDVQALAAGGSRGEE